jgi:23S rRNA maturation-related 3'-5' exoribonuclease YhaM
MIPEEQIEANKEEINELLQNLNRKGINDLVVWLNSTEFFIAPASTIHHLNVPGGLAQHSLNVYEVFKLLNRNYYREMLPTSTINITTLLHDVCKYDLYTLIDGVYNYRYKDKQPHGARSVAIIKNYIELTEKEEAMIRWHMGHYTDVEEFNIVKNALSKEHPEAHLLYFADHIASLFIDEQEEEL